MKRLAPSLVALSLGFALGQSYVFLTSVDRETLDPVGAVDQASHVIIENVYEGLYGYAGSSAEELEPRLATGYHVSDDARTFTFHLREGVTFHSGNPLTCRDVEYSVERALVVNPANSSVWIMAEALLGTDANARAALGDGASDAEYAEYWSAIDGSVECLDERTVVFELAAPDPAFVARTVTAPFMVVDSEWAKANGMWDGTAATWRDWVDADLGEHHLHAHMSGTGAYRLAEWVPGERVVAEANADYWGGAPSIQTVTYLLVEDRDEQVRALLAGEADMISAVERSELELLEGRPNVRIYDAATDPELDWATAGVWTLYFNQLIDPEGNAFIGSGALDGAGIPPDLFSEREARLCFRYAFDPEAFVETALGGAGELYTMALPPSLLGYDPTIPKQVLDLSRAELFCRAAWGGRLWEQGMTVALPVVEGVGLVETPARILKANLESLNPGFTVELVPVDWGAYWDAVDARHLPLELAGWVADYPDPYGFVHAYYSSEGYYGGWYGYANELIEELIDEARATSDPARLADVYGAIGRIAADDAPVILLPEPTVHMVMSDKVSGVYFNPMLAGGFLWKDIAKAE